MNLALPAALILFLALPGFIFVYAYKGHLRPQNDALVSNASMTLASIVGLLGALIAHAIWVPVANLVASTLSLKCRVDIDSVVYLLAGEYKDQFQPHADSFTHYPYAVGSYFFSLYLAAALAGIAVHHCVRRTGLDTSIAMLRFNKWHYLFSGDDKKVIGVLVTATCRHNDHTSLYTGLLQTYDFTAEGQLELLVLLSAGRAALSATPDGTAPQFEPIAGDKFLLWCKDVNTLNIDYLYANAATTTAPPP